MEFNTSWKLPHLCKKDHQDELSVVNLTNVSLNHCYNDIVGKTILFQEVNICTLDILWIKKSEMRAQNI